MSAELPLCLDNAPGDARTARVSDRTSSSRRAPRTRSGGGPPLAFLAERIAVPTPSALSAHLPTDGLRWKNAYTFSRSRGHRI
jgi:hypothetical protein